MSERAGGSIRYLRSRLTAVAAGSVSVAREVRAIALVVVGNRGLGLIDGLREPGGPVTRTNLSRLDHAVSRGHARRSDPGTALRIKRAGVTQSSRRPLNLPSPDLIFACAKRVADVFPS